MSSDSDEESSSSSDMSSPEARPNADELGLGVSDDSDSGSQSPQRAASQQDSESESSPKQAQADSDDEDDQPVRRRQVSNDDEDDDQPVRRRQVSNDDEDEEDDDQPVRRRQVLNSDDEEQEVVKQKQKRRTRVASSSSSGSSQRRGSDEEEQHVTQRQSSGHEEAEGSDEENVIAKRRDEEDQRSEKSASDNERRSEGDHDQQDDNDDGRQSVQAEEEDIPETRIEIDLPRIDVDFGTETHFVKLPNFLSVETRPFDEQQFEDEAPQDDVLDEEGRVRLKLKVENTIRWRVVTDEHGNEQRESNARIVRWSDGSLSMHLGDEVFDVHVMPLHDDFNHLFLKQGNGLEGLTVFRTKLTFRPHSTDSHTHKKVTLSMADRTARAAQKVKMIPIVQGNPELAKLQLAKKEDEQARAQLKRENRQRILRARQRRSGLTQSMLEGDIDEEEGAVSISAMKRDARARRSMPPGPSQRSARFASSDDEDAHSAYSDDDSDLEFGKKRKKRTKMVLDEADDDDDA